MSALPQWRTMALLFALLAVSVVSVVSYGLIGYRMIYGSSPGVETIKDNYADSATYLLLLSFVSAMAGTGKARILVMVSAVMGIVPWINFGFL
jgi:hypothetical protein